MKSELRNILTEMKSVKEVEGKLINLGFKLIEKDKYIRTWKGKQARVSIFLRSKEIELMVKNESHISVMHFGW